MDHSEKKRISFVIPAHNEEVNLRIIHRNITSILENNDLLKTYDYEIVFVDDGSRDKTAKEIERLCQKDQRVRGVIFSRNFGKEMALSAGLEYASGDAIITLDADGQHPVERIPEFLEKWEEGYHIVYNKRPKTEGVSFFKGLSSRAFYWFFNAISDFKLEEGTTDYRLMDRIVVNEFLHFKEKNRIFRGLIDWLEFKKIALTFDAKERMDGTKPRYTFWKLLRLSLNSITSFSLFPLKMVGYFGGFIILLSLAFFALYFLQALGFHTPLTIDRLSLILLMNTFLIGVVLISLGLIAIYIANIHEEVKGRPLYVVREKMNFGSIKHP